MKKTIPKRQGKIIPNGVKPEIHEMDIILFFTGMGKDVEIIVPSNTPHSRKPDFIIDGLEWEAKSPMGNKRRTLERSFYDASNQSQNIIIDLRHFKGSQPEATKTLEKCFKDTRRVRRLQIIDKSNRLRVYKK